MYKAEVRINFASHTIGIICRPEIVLVAMMDIDKLVYHEPMQVVFEN